jgi:multidrug efflux system membrane fusion protein
MDTNRFEEESRLLLDPEEDRNPAPKKGAGRWFVLLLVLAGLGYGGYYAWGHWVKAAAADATTAQPNAGGGRGRGGRGGGRGGGGVGARGAAVVTVAARKVDMPVYLRGLGTAAASNTVTVRSRVDGQLVRVAFREGQFVQQGELLAEIDKRPFEVQLAQAKGQLARDQALLQSAMSEQQRNQLLLEKGLIPRQQFDLQAATVGQYEGSIQADQAAIDSANLQITYSRIIAPISGQIGLRLVDQGNIVRAADPSGMIVITQLQPIAVLFSIPEDNLGDVLKKLRAGQELRVEAWDHDDTRKIADGVLLTADNQIDPTTGTSKLKAIFDNKNNGLYPNQFVNVRLLVDVLKSTVVIPGATVQRGAQGTFVYVVGENSTAELRPVTIKNSEGNDVAIASGVQPGDMVILEGMDKVQDGARVDVQTPGAEEAAADNAPAGNGGGGREGRGRGGRGGRGGQGGQGRGQRKSE